MYDTYLETSPIRNRNIPHFPIFCPTYLGESDYNGGDSPFLGECSLEKTTTIESMFLELVTANIGKDVLIFGILENSKEKAENVSSFSNRKFRNIVFKKRR